MSPKAFVAGLDDAIDRTSRLVGRPSSVLRPFACDGNPLDCEVFLVGINPASQVPWDPYWDREACSFDKANWLVSYEKARIARKGEKVRSES